MEDFLRTVLPELMTEEEVSDNVLALRRRCASGLDDVSTAALKRLPDRGMTSALMLPLAMA